MKDMKQRACALTEKISLEQPYSHDVMQGEPIPYDMVDGSGNLLLAKGMPLTRMVWKMLMRRQIYVISREYSSQTKFSSGSRSQDVTILKRIYCSSHVCNPTQLQEVVKYVDNLLAELEQDSQLYSTLRCLKNHDDFTYAHSVNVAILAAMIGRSMGLTQQELRWLTMGSILHDVGKMKIPRELLCKQGGLTKAEYKLIRQHPCWGEESLALAGLPRPVLAVVRHHHERWNGKGYPDALERDCIHLNAQIAALADVFEAVTADRPYHKGMPVHHAVELLVSNEGGEFSPLVVQAFLDHITLFPPNALVTLNTGERGVVIEVPRRFPTRPRVRIVYAAGRGERCSEYVVDLLVKPDVYITSIDYGCRA